MYLNFIEKGIINTVLSWFPTLPCICVLNTKCEKLRDNFLHFDASCRIQSKQNRLFYCIFSVRKLYLHSI